MATDEPTTEDEESSPFRSEAEYDATVADVYREVLDNWVISPLKILWDDYRGRVGLLILTFYILMGTVGVLVVREPILNQGPRLITPFENMAFPLGTTDNGVGLLAQVVHATPAMFKMMIAGAIFANGAGVIVGLLAGYSGGNLDKALMTFTDTLGSIPGLPLLMILVAIIDPQNPYLIGVVLSIQRWTGGARGIRAQTLPLRNKEYVEAARSMGQSKSSVLIKQILPELLPMITIGLLGGATWVISASVGLYFIGILPFTTQNWGVILNQAIQGGSGALYSLDAAHWLVVPLVTITGLTFGLTLLSQAFDQVFNPRVRARHEARKREAEPEEEVGPSDATSQIQMR